MAAPIPSNFYKFKIEKSKLTLRPELEKIGFTINEIKYEMRLDKKLKRVCKKMPKIGDYLYYAHPFVQDTVCRCRVISVDGWAISDSGDLYTVVSYSQKQKCFVMDMQITKEAAELVVQARAD